MWQAFDLQKVYRKWPLLAGALVAATGAVAALSVSTQSQTFPLVLHSLVVIGTIASLIAIATDVRFTGVGIGLMVMGCAVILVNQDLGPWTDTFFPVDLQALEESQIAVVFGWMLAGFCFMQGSQNSGAFVAATGMAIFGLMATVNLNPELIATFWVYIFGVIFMWGYERLLDLSETEADQERPPNEWVSWARWHLSSSAMLVLALMVLAFGIGTVAFYASPNMYERMSRQVRNITGALPTPTSYAEHESDFRVGTGPVNLPDTPAFHVATSNPTLWRVGAYDLYNGQGWQQTLTRRISLIREGSLTYRIPGRESAGPAEPTDTFYFQSSLPRALPTATMPVEIKFEVAHNEDGRIGYPTEDFTPVRVDAYSGLHLDNDWFADYVDFNTSDLLAAHYTVASRPPPTDPEALRGRGDEYYEYLEEHYIDQVPLQAIRELEDLVVETTRGIEDPYDRVVALRDMIEDRCLYTLQAPAVPRGRDAAVYFLMNSQRGACDLFATGLAVSARIAGVPARVVTGYQVGEYDQETGRVLVRDSDAHAWVEVYFPEIGWVPFDMQATEQYAGRSWLDLLRIGHAKLGLGILLRRVGQVLLVLIVLYAAVSAFYDPTRLLSIFPRREKISRLEAVSRDYRDLYRQIARRSDLDPQDWMTPREVVEASIQNTTAPAGLVERLKRLNDQFYDLRYDRRPSPEKISRVQDGIDRIRRRLKTFKPHSS